MAEINTINLNPNDTPDNKDYATDRLQFIGRPALFTTMSGSDENYDNMKKTKGSIGIDFAKYIISKLNSVTVDNLGLDGNDYNGDDYTIGNSVHDKYHIFQQTVKSDNELDTNSQDDNLNITETKHNATSYKFTFSYRRPAIFSSTQWSNYLNMLVNQAVTYWDRYSVVDTADNLVGRPTSSSSSNTYDVRGVVDPRRTFWTTDAHNPIVPNDEGVWEWESSVTTVLHEPGFFTTGVLKSFELNEEKEGSGTFTLELTSDYNRFVSFQMYNGRAWTHDSTTEDEFIGIQPNRQDRNFILNGFMVDDSDGTFNAGLTEIKGWELRVKQDPRRSKGITLSTGGIIDTPTQNFDYLTIDGGVIKNLAEHANSSIGFLTEQLKSAGQYGGVDFGVAKDIVVRGGKQWSPDSYGDTANNTIETKVSNGWRKVGKDHGVISMFSWDSDKTTVTIGFTKNADMIFDEPLDLYAYNRNGSLSGVDYDIFKSFDGAIGDEHPSIEIAFSGETRVYLLVQGNRTIAGYVNIAGEKEHNYDGNILGNQEMSGLGGVYSITYTDESNADIVVDGGYNYIVKNVKDTVIHISAQGNDAVLGDDIVLKPGSSVSVTPSAFRTNGGKAIDMIHIRDTGVVTRQPVTYKQGIEKEVDIKNVQPIADTELKTYERDYAMGAIAIQKSGAKMWSAQVPFIKGVQLPNFSTNSPRGWNYLNLRYPWNDNNPFTTQLTPIFRMVEDFD